MVSSTKSDQIAVEIKIFLEKIEKKNKNVEKLLDFFASRLP